MNSAAPETAMTPEPMSRWVRISLCAVIALFALYETWDSSMFFFILDDMWAKPGIGGVVTKIYMVTHPVFAVAALVCALTGRLRWAIMAMTGVVLGRWLWYLPGPNGSLDSKELYVTLKPTMMLVVIPPIMAAGAFVLARSNQLLGLATLLVCIPLIYSDWEMILFVTAVSIYGF